MTARADDDGPDTPRDAPSGVDGVLGALADPTRRRLLHLLAAGRPSSATTLAAQVTVSRQAVVQHLAVLERSRLVTGHRVGREVLFTVRPEPLLATASWMTHLAETWDERLRLLKQKAESPAAPGTGAPDRP
jgi:DNA-binding transcriptional ArsR family regulator